MIKKVFFLFLACILMMLNPDDSFGQKTAKNIVTVIGIGSDGTHLEYKVYKSEDDLNSIKIERDELSRNAGWERTSTSVNPYDTKGKMPCLTIISTSDKGKNFFGVGYGYSLNEALKDARGRTSMNIWGFNRETSNFTIREQGCYQ